MSIVNERELLNERFTLEGVLKKKVVMTLLIFTPIIEYVKILNIFTKVIP